MANTVSTRIQVDSSTARAAFNDLQGSLTKAATLGNLLGSAISKGLDVAAGSVGKVIGAFNESASIIQENISTAGDFAKLSGVSFDDAGEFIDNFSVRMAKAAANLPGVTQGYIGIGKSLTDELIPSFMDANGALDQDGMAKALDKISIAAGIRADAAGVTISESGRAIAKLLGGQSTMAELSRLDFFEKNKAVLATLKTNLEAQGKELKDLSSKEILELTQTALDVSDEVIRASSNSVGGLIDGFKSSLFDPTSGLFGFLRDTEKDTEGTQSVMAAAGRAIKLLVGPTGMFQKISKILTGLGLSVDPAAQMVAGLDRVSEWLKDVNAWLNAFRSKIDRGVLDSGNVGAYFSDIGSKIGDWFSSQINKLTSALTTMDSSAVGQKIGGMLAKAIDIATTYIANIDFVQFVVGVLNLGNMIAVSLISAVRQMNWGSFMEALGTVGLVIAGGLAAAAAAAAVSISAPIVAAIGAAAVLGVATIQAIGERIPGWINSIGDAFRNLFAGARDRIAAMLSIFDGSDGPSGFTGRGRRPVPNKATGLDQMGLLDAIARENAASPSGAQAVIANNTEAIFNRGQQASLLSALNSPRGGAGLNIQSLIINAGATNDARALARQVMAEIDREYQRYSLRQVGAAY